MRLVSASHPSDLPPSTKRVCSVDNWSEIVPRISKRSLRNELFGAPAGQKYVLEATYRISPDARVALDWEAPVCRRICAATK